MIIRSAKFVGSYVKVNKCPEPVMPEYAFIGRSNVGKSSLINMLTNRNKLAKTSSTPGKTQLINHFLIDESWYMVDLPGYGYAKVSKTQRRQWEKFIRNYLLQRANLQCLLLLIDSRIPPQKSDLEFANWLGEIHVPFVIVFTKADKNKPSVLKANMERFKKAMLETWNDLPQQFCTSSTKGTGKKELLEFIDKTNQTFGIESSNQMIE